MKKEITEEMYKNFNTFLNIFFEKECKNIFDFKELNETMNKLSEFLQIYEIKKFDEKTTIENDRSYLDVAIEKLIFILSISLRLNYIELIKDDEEIVKLIKKIDIFKKIIEIKFYKYGNEIFKEQGMDIIEIVENGVIVREIKNENILN